MARTLKIRRLLRFARMRVRRLEMLLLLAEREEAARCEHVFKKEYPTGMRDNGEIWLVCTRCGVVQ